MHHNWLLSNRDYVDGLHETIPFLIPVREHTASLRADHQTLLHHLTAGCRRPYNLEPPPSAIEYLLLNGKALVVIDGLDELGDARHRAAFSDLINGFARRYPAARMVVTSRLIGYYEVPLDDHLFAVAEIAPFTTEQTQTYVEASFRLDSRFDDSNRQTHVSSFMRESEAAHDIRRNPLMLSLLCVLYTSMNYIPRNKPELYEKCAELLFETWDRSRGIEVSFRFGAHIKPAVQHMAWNLLNDLRGRQAIPRAELAQSLTGLMRQKRYEDEDEAGQAASDFIDFCTGRAWVLTDVGSDKLQPLYGFVHRTFLEYFAANQLVKNDPRAEAVWAQLKRHVGDGGWEVMSQLAVQLLDRWHENGADELLSLALKEVSEDHSISPRSAASVLTFCSRALEAVVPGNDALRRLVSATLRLAVVPDISKRWRRIDDPQLEDEESIRAHDEPLRYLLSSAAIKTDSRPAAIYQQVPRSFILRGTFRRTPVARNH